MHMADALISPTVGITMLAVSGGLLGLSVKKIQREMDDRMIPLMGVMGAFVFAAQMINFTIPGTGSSGHIGGGLLLAAVLGPWGAFMAIASVLLVQALFFADGGLLAWGCNLFNMGFFPCFIAYPLIYRFFVKENPSRRRIFWGSLLGVVMALQLGAFSVVLETLFSGRTELSFGSFILLMQPIHLAIGIVEGLVTGSVLSFLLQAGPELLTAPTKGKKQPAKKILLTLALLTAFTGGILSLYASEYPDGLEWSIQGITGSTELEDGTGVLEQQLGAMQQKTAFLPDYSFPDADEKAGVGTSVSGILGGSITLLLIAVAGKLALYWKKQSRKAGYGMEK